LFLTLDCFEISSSFFAFGFDFSDSSFAGILLFT